MSISIQTKLDPVLETITLLFQSYNSTNLKDTIVSQLNEMNMDGEYIYQNFLKPFEKYIHTFHENKISDEQEAFYFQDTSFEFYCTFTAPFMFDNKLIDSIHTMENEHLLEFLFEHSQELYDVSLPSYTKESYEDFMKVERITTFIDKLGFTEHDKWKMLLIFQNPIHYYQIYAKILKCNFPAFEKAQTSVKAPITKYMKQYEKSFTDEIEWEHLFLGKNLKNNTIKTVIPSMAVALGVIISNQVCYYGILLNHIYKQLASNKKENEYLVASLKALSDQSKLDILISLKKSPKYALELANQIGLTPATVSHHMNTLLTHQLVYLDKENGKYYYHVNEDTIKNMITQLSDLLL